MRDEYFFACGMLLANSSASRTLRIAIIYLRKKMQEKSGVFIS